MDVNSWINENKQLYYASIIIINFNNYIIIIIL